MPRDLHSIRVPNNLGPIFNKSTKPSLHIIGKAEKRKIAENSQNKTDPPNAALEDGAAHAAQPSTDMPICRWQNFCKGVSAGSTPTARTRSGRRTGRGTWQRPCLPRNATRAAAIFTFLCMQSVSGDLGKLMPGFSKANFRSYGPSI